MTNLRPRRRQRRRDYDVQVVEWEERTLACVRSEVPLQDLDAEVEQQLRVVREHFRDHGVTATGRNVVVYVSSVSNGFVMLVDCIIGIEVFQEVPAGKPVYLASLPACTAATTTHWGDFSGVPDAHAALHDWCRANHRDPAGLNWEVYGDWTDDPAERRTDVFYALTT